jgi:methyltransferase family protein
VSVPTLAGDTSRIRRWNRRRLLRMLPKGSVGAEIGVWRGDFSAEILRTVRPAKLYLVDPWLLRTEPKYEHAMWGGATEQAQLNDVLRFVRERFREEIAAGVVEVVRQDSATAAAAFPAEHFDWIYLDGDHTYESVQRDLEAFVPKLKPAGVITGDDYDNEGWWENGVRRAVDELASGPEWTLRRVGFSQFLLSRNRA